MMVTPEVFVAEGCEAAPLWRRLSRCSRALSAHIEQQDFGVGRCLEGQRAAVRDGCTIARFQGAAIDPDRAANDETEGDPRANVLLKLADERGVCGEHVAMMRALQAALPETIGRALPVNVNGPIPAIMLDLGWPVAALKGIGLLCRTAGLIGHLTEEAERPIGFVMSGAGAAAIAYDGE